MRVADQNSDHQFLKGTAMDTPKPAMAGTMSCTMNGCHLEQPHDADTDGYVDGLMTVTVDEMQNVYRMARLVTADMNFSINHSVVSGDLAFKCGNCHGRNGWVLDWQQLGYAKDPRSGKKGGKKSK